MLFGKQGIKSNFIQLAKHHTFMPQAKLSYNPVLGFAFRQVSENKISIYYYSLLEAQSLKFARHPT
jgi:hypothetical protein